MLTRFLSVDIGVPTLTEGIALYRDKLGLSDLTGPVDEGPSRWQVLGLGDESCLRLMELGSGQLTEKSSSPGYGVQQLSFLVDDLNESRRRLEAAKVRITAEDGRLVISPSSAFGLTLALYSSDFVGLHRRQSSEPPRGLLWKFATADVSVPSVEDAFALYCDTLGMTQLTDVIRGTKGYLQYASVGIGTRSVVSFLEPIKEGPMQKRVAKVGYGFHQLSFLTDDVPKVVRHLRDSGLDVVIEEADWGETPNEAGPNTQEAFVHPRSAYGVLVEFFRTSDYVKQNHRPHPRSATAAQR